MNKNWNDRADKDLFFTILSVKNIGVISGAEWTTIGNHMRSLGYGFTNEGCRQHFQGLRRAQNKTESNGSGLDGQRKSDPTANPITRRPGPGRGRPRKAVSAPTAPADQGQPPQAITPASDTQVGGPSTPTPLRPTPVSESGSVPREEPAPILLEEQSIKRPRLDEMEVVVQQANDVEPVLALAADGIPGTIETYGSSASYYGEA
ncbi:hypothetical protein F5Y14DRAFT_401027 [Nemania sp. NC0429]|nr:hypothetical protein F5Y14DRAFT_401027 [Nemania sp. NC0429]